MKKTKNILICVLSIILVAIIVCVISLACIKKDFNYNFNNPEKIKVGINGTEYAVTDKNIENKIMELYDESFKTSVLSALFNGKAFDNKVFNEGYNNISNISNTGYWLILSYGSNKQDVNENTTFNTKVYDTVYVQVLNSDDFTTITAYLVNNSSSYYKYTTYASQSNLYSYLNEVFA